MLGCTRAATRGTSICGGRGWWAVARRALRGAAGRPILITESDSPRGYSGRREGLRHEPGGQQHEEPQHAAVDRNRGRTGLRHGYGSARGRTGTHTPRQRGGTVSGLITQTITGIGCCAAVLAGSTGVGANTARQLGEVGGRCPSREWELRAARGWRFLGAAQRVRESLVYDSADRNPAGGNWRYLPAQER